MSANGSVGLAPGGAALMPLKLAGTLLFRGMAGLRTGLCTPPHAAPVPSC